MEQLASMVNDPKRPVQFVFAGKAHPHDEPGKKVLQQIASLMRDSQFAEKFVFVETTTSTWDAIWCRALMYGK